VVKIALRAARSGDFVFARDLYFETMHGIERLFGWDQAREERNFAGFFKVEEVRIITADEQNVGWIQEQVEDRTINLGSFYVIPAMQGRRHRETSSRNTFDAGRCSTKSHDVGGDKGKSCSAFLREARISDYPRRPAQVLYEGRPKRISAGQLT
jgi:hypothetical protein